MENFMEALKLMGIGMATVFVVLIFIIYVGNFLVYLVNKYAPEEAKPAKGSASSNVTNAVDTNVSMAINLAIGQLTNGKKKAEKIERA